ncbi:MAG: hypothetical protein ACFHWX_13050 [Bacteroidota bacterium]
MASIKPSIYDPIGMLSPSDVNRIESEGADLISKRKVSGMDLVIQIDFMSPTGEIKFDEGGISKGDGVGKSIFSLGTYGNWSIEFFSKPAVLILFLDQGDGNYVLDALRFSEMLMDEGIPDLVRRYIRDEIMKKESSYVEIISSGFYAIGEALNPIYRQKLTSKGSDLLNFDKRYYRGHCVNEDCKYYEFTPHEKSILGPTLPKENIAIEGLSDLKLDYLNSTIEKIKFWGYTHKDQIVSNWPWERNGKYLKTPENTQGFEIPSDYFNVKRDNPWSVLTATIEEKAVGDELPTMGWLQISGWNATYCNFFTQDLSKEIFGYIPWQGSKTANEIHDYIINSSDFLIVLQEDVYNYIEYGFISYFTQLGIIKTNGERGPGHIALSWINKDVIIQAGSSTGKFNPNEIFDPNRVKIHVYLGFLRKKGL